MSAHRLPKLFLALVTTLAVAAPASATSFTITLSTPLLQGTPLTIAFGLTDGDPSVTNTATIGSFDFGLGGVATGTADCTLAGCSGDLSSNVTLTDASFGPGDFLAFFSQSFTAGDALSFAVDLTNNGGAPPDSFALYLCDSTLTTCYSDDSATGALLTVDFTGLQPLTFVANAASAVNLRAPRVEPQDVSEAPEPASVLLLGGGIVGTVLWRRRQRSGR